MIVIVGAGITGLSAAFELCRARAFPSRLLEASPRAGGLIRTDHIDGFIVEAGPDSVLAQKPAALELCEALGLTSQADRDDSPPRTAFVLKRGRLHPLPSPSVLGVPTTLRGHCKVRPVVAGRRARGWLSSGSFRGGVPTTNRLDRSSAGASATRRVGLIAEPLLGGIHAGDIETLSMQSLFPRFVDAEATLRQRPPGVPAAPASQPPEGRPVRTLVGGMGELVDASSARFPRDRSATTQRSTAIVRSADAERKSGRCGSRTARRGRRGDPGRVRRTSPATSSASVDAEAAALCARGALRLERERGARVAAESRRASAPRQRVRCRAPVQPPPHHRVHVGVVEVGRPRAGRHGAAPRVPRRRSRSRRGGSHRRRDDSSVVAGPVSACSGSPGYRTCRASRGGGERARSTWSDRSIVRRRSTRRLAACGGLFAAGSGFRSVGIPGLHCRRARGCSAARSGIRSRLSALSVLRGSTGFCRFYEVLQVLDGSEISGTR